METHSTLSASQRPSVPFADHVGVIPLVEGGGGGRALIPSAAELTNHIGSVHAGALFTVAEAASGAAVISVFGESLAGVFVVVLKAEISFRKIAHGPITAAARLSRPADDLLSQLHSNARLDFDVAVELRNEANDLVAEMAVVWRLSKRDRQSA
jgi:acyl-coenzyme A thioesterase PaaI-like protein